MAMTQAVCGLVLISVMGGVITNRLAPQHVQRYAVSYTKLKVLNTKENHFAALLIQTYWRAVKRRILPLDFADRVKKCTIGLRHIRKEKLLVRTAGGDPFLEDAVHKLSEENEGLKQQLIELRGMMERIEQALCRPASSS